jgi:hypothetical protein
MGYKSPVCTSLGTHHVSATESGRLMLCKICGFPGDDYEECRLLGYMYPVCTSLGTHYVSATELGYSHPILYEPLHLPFPMSYHASSTWLFAFGPSKGRAQSELLTEAHCGLPLHVLGFRLLWNVTCSIMPRMRQIHNREKQSENISRAQGYPTN